MKTPCTLPKKYTIHNHVTNTLFELVVLDSRAPSETITHFVDALGLSAGAGRKENQRIREGGVAPRAASFGGYFSDVKKVANHHRLCASYHYYFIIFCVLVYRAVLSSLSSHHIIFLSSIFSESLNVIWGSIPRTLHLASSHFALCFSLVFGYKGRRLGLLCAAD